MSTNHSGHLTDDQFTECVIVAPSPESEAHLRECARCREELDGFKTSLQDFTSAAFAWSEAQPVVSLRAAARPAKNQPWFVPAAWAVGAALLFAAVAPVVLHHERQANAPADRATVDAPVDSDAQIAEDNRLMRSVNMAIGMNDSSLQEYGLESPRPARLKSIAVVRSE